MIIPSNKERTDALAHHTGTCPSGYLVDESETVIDIVDGYEYWVLTISEALDAGFWINEDDTFKYGEHTWIVLDV